MLVVSGDTAPALSTDRGYASVIFLRYNTHNPSIPSMPILQKIILDNSRCVEYYEVKHNPEGLLGK
jgi:hypothetical protein